MQRNSSFRLMLVEVPDQTKLGGSFLVIMVHCGKIVWYNKNAHLMRQKSREKTEAHSLHWPKTLSLKFLLMPESSIMGTMALTHGCLGDIQYPNCKGVSKFHYKQKSLCSQFLLKFSTNKNQWSFSCVLDWSQELSFLSLLSGPK